MIEGIKEQTLRISMGTKNVQGVAIFICHMEFNFKNLYRERRTARQHFKVEFNKKNSGAVNN